MVAYWSDEGVTSFKAYMHISREELGAAIDEAHQRGHKVTGHLCSVTYREAADLGIDNLEHGLFASTDFPVRSMTSASRGTGTDPEGPNAAMVPLRMTKVWSAIAGRPDPSITRACVSATTGSSTLTNAVTAGDNAVCCVDTADDAERIVSPITATQDR